MSYLSQGGPPPPRYVQAGRASVAYQVIGEGPDIVLVPGFLDHIEAIWQDPGFADFSRQVASFARLIAFDKRGTGLSDRLPAGEEVRLDERMDDIRAVMDAVGVERAVLVAQADGVPVATVFAATFPERVSGLVAYAASARMLPAPGYASGVSAEAWEMQLDALEQRWGNPEHPAGIEVITPSRVDDPDWRSTLARMQRLTFSPPAARAYMRMVLYQDIRSILPAVQVPTLVLHRTGDRFVPLEQGRWYAEHIAGARLVELPGNDHFTNEGCPEEIEEFVTGHRGRGSPDNALATILFTDIVDSTQTATSLGDRKWRALLDLHDAMVRRQLERFRGQEIKHTGDGFLATFDGPARAIEAAWAIRDGSQALGMEIRAGLHTGVIELRGSDVSGTAVNLAARVQACAASSEVLVSRTVADLLAGSSFSFVDRGAHALKGVSSAWQLYAVA
jgi:class 3 adenylate cyclase/alpha-beta hydrolase superfamily lysophospholipase